jgi:hypothetical protein
MSLTPVYSQGASYRIGSSAPVDMRLTPIYAQGASYRIANTPVGSPVTVTFPGGTVTFGGVTTAGTTTARAIPPNSAGTLPGTFVVVGTLAFEISTTAVVAPPILVGLVVPGVTDQGAFAQLRIFHGEGGQLVDRTVAWDFGARTVWALVNSLSPFVVAQPVNRPPVVRARDLVRALSPAACVASVEPAEVDAGSFDPDQDDQLVLSLSPAGPFGPGGHHVTLTATDRHGLSASAVATITVRDVTAPLLVCAADLTSEFTDLAGASVTFPPPAVSDACAVTSLVSAPASGSVFAIGTTPVTWTATDPSGNAASCTFRVTVLGALGVKLNVLGELGALRASMEPGGERDDLDRGIEWLRRSIETREWIDQTHLRAPAGASVFNFERHAVAEIAPIVPSTTIDRIVRSDRLVAAVAIENARASRGAVHEVAIEFLARGDEEWAAGDVDRAIARYRQAWIAATRVVPP